MAFSCSRFIKVLHFFYFYNSQISNSRKSFIFSKFTEDEDNLDILGKKKIDIDTIRLKLKLKIYNDIYEVVDDVLKMIKIASVTLNKGKIYQ